MFYKYLIDSSYSSDHKLMYYNILYIIYNIIYLCIYNHLD